MEQTVQLKASLRRIIASSFFSRAQEKHQHGHLTTAYSHAPQLAPTLHRTTAEITTKCKAFKSKSMEVRVQHYHVATITREKPDGGWCFASDNGGVSARNVEKSGGSFGSWCKLAFTPSCPPSTSHAACAWRSSGPWSWQWSRQRSIPWWPQPSQKATTASSPPARNHRGSKEREREREERSLVSKLKATPPHPPLHPTPCSPLCSWCCRLGGDPAPCAGQIEIRGNKTRGSPHRPPS